MASSVKSVAIASGQVGPQGDNVSVTFWGFTIKETAGSTAHIRVRADGVVTGDILETISLVANESAGDDYGIPGIAAGKGLYVQVVSGSVEGSLRYV